MWSADQWNCRRGWVAVLQPDHQNRGIGRRLVQRLAACAADKGIRSLHIGVLTTNLDARRFYELLGGEDISERFFDGDGVLLPERIYAWPDITSLMGIWQGMSE
jgi:GNAT superfamily N-acetyltransferase